MAQIKLNTGSWALIRLAEIHFRDPALNAVEADQRMAAERRRWPPPDADRRR